MTPETPALVPAAPSPAWPLLLVASIFADLGLRVAEHLFPGRQLFQVSESGELRSTLSELERGAVARQRVALIKAAWLELESPELAAYLATPPAVGLAPPPGAVPATADPRDEPGRVGPYL